MSCNVQNGLAQIALSSMLIESALENTDRSQSNFHSWGLRDNNLWPQSLKKKMAFITPAIRKTLVLCSARETYRSYTKPVDLTVLCVSFGEIGSLNSWPWQTRPSQPGDEEGPVMGMGAIRRIDSWSWKEVGESCKLDSRQWNAQKSEGFFSWSEKSPMSLKSFLWYCTPGFWCS